MTCTSCGKGNVTWARTCAQCGQPLAVASTDAASVAEPVARELQLARPEPEEPRESEANALREALAHMPAPVVTPVLIAANILVFVAMVAAGVSWTAPDGPTVLRWGAVYGPSVTGGEWWRLLSATFLHAGVLHLLFNMFALLSIGGLTERLFGRLPFLLLYLLAGLGGSVMSVSWHPLTVGVGASGAIFGLYGALLGYLLVARRSMPRESLMPLTSGAAIFVLYNLMSGLFIENVDAAAHVGGLVAGALVGVALADRRADRVAGATAGRGLAVAAVGGALLALAAARIPAYGDWSGALRDLDVVDRRSIARLTTSMEELTAGQIDSTAFAARVDADILAPWTQLRDRFATMPLPERERALAMKAVAFMDLRGRVWRLRGEAFRREDMALLAESNTLQAAANAASDELTRALGGTPQPAPPPATSAPPADAGQRALATTMEEVGRLETGLFKTFRDGVASVKARRMTEDAFATEIETKIVRPWAAETERVAKVQTSGPFERSRRRAEEYMRLRGQAWALMVKALRTKSPALMKQADAVHVRAAAIVRSPQEAPAAPPAGTGGAPPAGR